MAAGAVQVQLARHLEPLQFERVLQAVDRRDGVVEGVGQERRRRLRRHLDVGQQQAGFRLDQVRRVDEHGEVRPARHLVGGIDGGVLRYVVVRAGQRGQVAAGGEAEHPDLRGIDVELLGPTTNEPDRALGVDEGDLRGRVLGVFGAARHPVLEDERGHPDGVQPGRDFFAFEVPGEDVVPAARGDHDRRAARLVRGRGEHGERRLADVGHPPDRPGFLLHRHVLFGRGRRRGLARRGPRPQVDDHRLGRLGP